jgi:hypothetical protein
MRWLVGVVAFLVLGSCDGGRSSGPKPDRRAELERRLRAEAGDPLHAAATEYRELMGEHPDALRKIAEAYGRRGEHAAQFEVLRTLITREQGTTDERLPALELARKLGRVDEAMYKAGLGWIKEAAARDPWCRTFAQLVTWTEGRTEHAWAIEQALLGCPRDHERARWYTSRASQPGSRGADDACRAVVHGESSLAQMCVDRGATGWRLAVAKALLGEDRLANLGAAARDPEVTAFALLELARTPGVPTADACAALARARAIELGWLPRAGDLHALNGRYDALRRAASCR